MNAVVSNYGVTVTMANGDTPFISVRGDRVSIDGLHLASFDKFTHESQRKFRTLLEALSQGVRNQIWDMHAVMPPLDTVILIFDRMQPWIVTAGRIIRDKDGKLWMCVATDSEAETGVEIKSDFDMARLGWSVMPKW